MTARSSLFGLCEEWSRRTEIEGLAIRACDWEKVNECQEIKLALQRSIVEWTAAARAESQLLGLSPSNLEAELRSLLQPLMQAESRNQAWLAELQASLLARCNELNESARNLRNVRRSYVLPNSVSWESYS